MWWPNPQILENNLQSVSMIDNSLKSVVVRLIFFYGTKLYKSFGSFMSFLKIKIQTASISIFSQECQE